MNKKQLPYYELHITIPCDQNVEELKRALEWFLNPMELTLPEAFARNFGISLNDPILWKSSNITDDIILGDGPKIYLTCNISKGRRLEWVEDYLAATVDSIVSQGIPVIRAKIEVVIRDKIYQLTGDRKKNLVSPTGKPLEDRGS